MLSTTRGLRVCRRGCFVTRIIGSSGRARSSGNGRRRLVSVTGTRCVSSPLEQKMRRSVRPRRWRYLKEIEECLPQRRKHAKKKPEMTITIPELSLVVLIGPSGCGKSTFARKHFKPTEVLSSDGFRGLVSDDENDQSATDDAFAALHYVAARRLARGRLTVVDATTVQPEARKPLVALAREYHVLP